MTQPDRQLRAVTIGDEPAAWEQAGFTVIDGRISIGQTVLDLVGAAGARGIRSLAVEGMTHEVDGMPFGPTGGFEPVPTTHRNGVTAIDHVVAFSPNMNRTTAALEQAGLELRRTREFGTDDDPRRQVFFWLGNVILELAGSDTATGDGPAILWGLALSAPELDTAVAELGERIGPPRDAVQAGRRIATIRTKELDISIPLALMTAHQRSGTEGRAPRR